MTKIGIIAIVVFIVLTVLTALFFRNYYKGKYSEKMLKFMGLQIGFWQGVVIISMACTILTLLLFKWTNLVAF